MLVSEGETEAQSTLGDTQLLPSKLSDVSFTHEQQNHLVSTWRAPEVLLASSRACTRFPTYEAELTLGQRISYHFQPHPNLMIAFALISGNSK